MGLWRLSSEFGGNSRLCHGRYSYPRTEGLDQLLPDSPVTDVALHLEGCCLCPLAAVTHLVEPATDDRLPKIDPIPPAHCCVAKLGQNQALLPLHALDTTLLCRSHLILPLYVRLPSRSLFAYPLLFSLRPLYSLLHIPTIQGFWVMAYLCYKSPTSEVWC